MSGHAFMAFLERAYPRFRGESWRSWRALFAALFGLAMDEAQLTLFRQCTGRQDPPTTQAREAWLVIGRRGGKSLAMCLIAVFLACVKSYVGLLAPGERGVGMLIAADRRQARVLRRYIGGLLHAHPSFAAMITRETADAIELNN